jgi:gamma-glutamylcyclotransferase (GGCT)/AIG2-like uncharacterized protein YtfP
MSDGTFHLFVYGTLLRGGAANALLDSCERVRPAAVAGTLYDVGGEYPALMLYGESPVRGEIWRCPNDLLPRLDTFEGVGEQLFRRVAVAVEGTPCWTYVAGPAIARELTPSRRLPDGVWEPAQ